FCAWLTRVDTLRRRSQPATGRDPRPAQPSAPAQQERLPEFQLASDVSQNEDVCTGGLAEVLKTTEGFFMREMRSQCVPSTFGMAPRIEPAWNATSPRRSASARSAALPRNSSPCVEITHA